MVNIPYHGMVIFRARCTLVYRYGLNVGMMRNSLIHPLAFLAVNTMSQSGMVLGAEAHCGSRGGVTSQHVQLDGCQRRLKVIPPEETGVHAMHWVFNGRIDENLSNSNVQRKINKN